MLDAGGDNVPLMTEYILDIRVMVVRIETEEQREPCCKSHWEMDDSFVLKICNWEKP